MLTPTLAAIDITEKKENDQQSIIRQAFKAVAAGNVASGSYGAAKNSDS